MKISLGGCRKSLNWSCLPKLHFWLASSKIWFICDNSVPIDANKYKFYRSFDPSSDPKDLTRKVIRN